VYGRILLPIDGRPCSEHAAGRAFALAASFGSEVVLVHVLAERRTSRPREACERLEACGRALLERWERISRQNGIATRARLICAPDAGDAITRLAVSEECDLIVMGTRGRDRAGDRPMLGTVAERVARTATLPVMLVRRGGEGRLAVETSTHVTVPAPLAVEGLAAQGGDWSAND
jgi:nucleotide-binding universal stress UspA family protein